MLQDKYIKLSILCSGINESLPCFRNSTITGTGKILCPERLDWSEISSLYMFLHFFKLKFLRNRALQTSEEKTKKSMKISWIEEDIWAFFIHVVKMKHMFKALLKCMQCKQWLNLQSLSWVRETIMTNNLRQS